MSIKSRTPGIASDIPLMEKSRQPIYKGKNRAKANGIDNSQVNNISRYVETNLAKTVKPRGGEHR